MSGSSSTTNMICKPRFLKVLLHLPTFSVLNSSNIFLPQVLSNFPGFFPPPVLVVAPALQVPGAPAEPLCRQNDPWMGGGLPGDTGTLFNSHPFARGWHHQLSFEVAQKPFSRPRQGFPKAWSCCLRTTFVWGSRAALHEQTCLGTRPFQFLTHICILKLVKLHLSTSLPPGLAPAPSFQAELCPAPLPCCSQLQSNGHNTLWSLLQHFSSSGWGFI